MTGSAPRATVVTLTPAPVLDRTYFVRDLVPGGVNRSEGVAEELAGKGINVSRALQLADVDAPGIVPIGNSDPSVLERTGSKFITPVWIDGTLRVSTTIIDVNGTTTRVTETPRPLSQRDWEHVLELTEQTVKDTGAKWLVVAGAHPQIKETGKEIDLGELFDRMDKLGVRVALDTSGQALSFWSRSGRAAVIKPNAEELASAVGRTLHTIGDVIDAAQELCRHGIEAVLASLGADGMIAVTAEGVIGARTAPVKVINTVGAGDATLAGFLSAVATNPLPAGEKVLGVGFDVVGGVQMAVRWGALKVQQHTSGLDTIENLPESFLNETPDRSKQLDEPAIAH